MARTDPRGGPQTRQRIAEVASGLFIARGFDAVTVAEVARAAGVSSVTVFKHFPSKEALFLDRGADAADLVRSAVRDRAEGTDVLTSLRDTVFRLLKARDPLSGFHERSVPFFRTVAQSPALRAGARAVAADLQRVLTDELERDAAFDGDAPLFAALFVAGYGADLADTAARLVAGDPVTTVRRAHRRRLELLCAALAPVSGS